MSTEIVTLTDTGNFNQLAAAMGMGADMDTKKSKSSLARLKIDHFGVDGETEIKGKTKTVKVVDPGAYSLELSDGIKIYQENPTIRLFQQKFMYKRYIKSNGNGNGDAKGMFVKTIMANDLKSDLIDNTGGVNCGKPSGWIEDYQALPENQKNLIKSIKRVRVLFGLATFDHAVDIEGLDVDPQKNVAFIYEVDNREAFKTFGAPIAQMAKQSRVLPQQLMKLSTEERKIASGNKYYVPSIELLPDVIQIKDSDQSTFKSFTDWIDSYNNWVDNSYKEALDIKKQQDSDTLVSEFVDIENTD